MSLYVSGGGNMEKTVVFFAFTYIESWRTVHRYADQSHRTLSRTSDERGTPSAPPGVLFVLMFSCMTVKAKTGDFYSFNTGFVPLREGFVLLTGGKITPRAGVNIRVNSK
jgi:hypothetical protein